MAAKSKLTKKLSPEQQRIKDEKEENQRLEFEKFMMHAGYWRKNNGQLEQVVDAPYKTQEEIKYEFESWKVMMDNKNKKR